ncbi:Transferrin [Orchesella cincta]|uniref:Transferrin n=1 Tax=Orchesella cincta TaxID=48709 RepID=A0A1D2MLP4_ORCCI|nr:Transferrin [Orchesella cincta]
MGVPKLPVLIVVNLLLCGLGGPTLVVVAAEGGGNQNQTHFRICVPEVNYAQCLSMVEDGHPKLGRIVCVHATDKIACIEKIVKDEADFIPLEPEEIYVANRFQKSGFVILGEIRSEEFSTRDFRYEPVAVVRKSSGITSVSALKGKRSCHTGFGRNAGWKVPFSHLMEKGELSPLCDQITAPTPERDLNAVANYFDSACAPGSWVPEKETDKRLKQAYSKLCALCKDPSTCGKDDPYSNYDGALRCLTENEGDVAWTKMDAVVKFFKLKDTTPLTITNEYELLCWDGSTLPLTTDKPCSWAKRPWKAFVASSRIGSSASQVKDLQDQITLFRSIAQESGQVTNVVPQWISSVLEFQKISDVEFNYEPHRVKTISPSVYLNLRNFTVTIEKPSCATKKTIRFCVRSEVEKLKCTALRMAAMGQRILPGFSCILGENAWDCAERVSRGEADVVVLSAKDSDRAQKKLQLVPILSEVEETDVEKREQSAPYRFAVAVIRSEIAGEFRNISNLRGRRSCHGSVRSVAGWNAPLSVLREVGEISGPICGSTIELGRYFNNQSCVPGAKDPTLGMDWLPTSLCSLCAGDGDGPGGAKAQTPETACADDNSERYYGDLGALRCLQDKVADVAFLDHVGLHLKTIGSDLKLDRMKLLCPNGTVTELAKFRECNWGRVSPQKVMARGGDEDVIVEREDARLSLLKAQDIFRQGGKSELVLRLFGPYYGNKDLLFQDTSVGLCDELSEGERSKENKLIRDFDYCTTSAAGIKKSLFSAVFLVAIGGWGMLRI